MSASRTVSAFLSFVVLTAAGCGGGDAQVPGDQQAVAEEIKQLGGLYFVDKKAPDDGIFSVNLSGTKADDAMVAKLAAFPGLKHLKLNAAPVTNACTASLKNMKKLETLDIGNTKFTAAGVDSLRTALPNVEITANIPPEVQTDSAEVLK
jgi:hypothetical protein